MAAFSIHPEHDPFEWQEKAHEDLALAREVVEKLGAGARYPAHVCFLCQQSIEKHLKAIIVAAGQEASRTHDLEILLESCITFSSELTTFVGSLAWLTPFATEVRYPQEDDVMAEDAERALQQAQKIEQVVSQFLQRNRKQ